MSEREWHYHVLGLEPEASAEDAKAAFRRLTLIHHPDRKGGCAERFLQIRDAMTFIETERLEREKEKEKSGVQDWWRGSWSGQLSMLGKRKPNRGIWYKVEAAHDKVEPSSSSSASNHLEQNQSFEGQAASGTKNSEEKFAEEIRRLRWQSRLRGLKAREVKVASERAKNIKKLGDGTHGILPQASSDQLF